MPSSRIRTRTTIWDPQVDEIQVEPHQSAVDGHVSWYLKLAGYTTAFVVGTPTSDLASEAAAMRQLAAAAAELAALLEDRLNASAPQGVSIPDLKASAVPDLKASALR